MDRIFISSAFNVWALGLTKCLSREILFANEYYLQRNFLGMGVAFTKGVGARISFI